MSMYDNEDKDTLYYYLAEFLKEHKVSELLEVVAAAVRYEQEETENA